MAKFISGGPTGVHNTQKIRKHVLKRGITRDMNAGAGAVVNSKNMGSYEAFRYAAPAKAVGPRFGKTKNPRKASFGRKGAGRILPRRGK
jgi:hypothetical protein